MTYTKLIADSGTTKTDWRIVRDGTLVKSICTKGINPYFQSYEEIQKEIEVALLPQINDIKVDEVYFYGAGCAFDKAELMREVISLHTAALQVHVHTDLLAAVHSTCGHEPGIACIIGTGSNSCFYDGKQIVKNIPPLGFILGDEGGGVTLGRLLVSDVLKEMLPRDLRDAFYERFKLTQADILDRVYKQPFPNRFLASLSPFLADHLDRPEIYRIVFDSFISFLTRNVMHYDYQQYITHFVGSIAYYYQEILKAAAEKTNVCVGKIIKNPIDGLMQYTR